LQSITLFDVYEGKNIPAGKKSYAVAITLQDMEKTLNDKQIDAVMHKIMQSLEKKPRRSAEITTQHNNQQFQTMGRSI